LKKVLAILCMLCAVSLLPAQSTFKAVILTLEEDEEEPEALAGVTVNIAEINMAAFSDSTGYVELNNIPAGEHFITYSYIGFFKKKQKLTFPLDANKLPLQILLEPQEEELEEVTIVSTRTNTLQEDNPTRVDVVNSEEMQERSIDKPSSISHAIKEQPGIQLQRTSASSGMFNIRLQGLHGKYVQLLKDGYPLFGGFSNSLGITQIPPLDLQQIEIIKGPASTLYGGDAISGVINLISKTPTEDLATDLLFNVENTKSIDAGLYMAQRFKWFGFTLTGMYRNQQPKDWNRDNFSDMPKLQRYNILPQLYFWIKDKVLINAGVNYAYEDRLGGTMQYIQGKEDTVYDYFEKNLSTHLGTNFKLEYDAGEKGKLTVRNSVNYFTRNLNVPAYKFAGNQLATLSEINYRFVKGKHDLVAGLDFKTDKFTETPYDTFNRSYNYLTAGFFAQYIFRLSEKTAFEGGFRLDYNTQYKVLPLPHIAWMQKWNEHFSTRVNAGMGYKLPTVFQEESEEALFRNVFSIANTVKPELSAGGTADLAVKLPNINGVSITITQMYFYTRILRPLLASTNSIDNCLTLDCEQLRYNNGNGYIESRGVETGFRLGYRGFGFGINYSLIDHNRKINNVRSIAPLTAKHQLAILAGYELLGKFTMGIDAYYFSPQKLSDGSTTRSIWELGINTQLDLKYILIFANLENILDIRQSRYGDIVSPYPTYSHPRFADLYAPLEGTILNAGFKLRLGEITKKVSKKQRPAKDDD
jgi:outer membrane receptor for ferrienterochelin and colicins